MTILKQRLSIEHYIKFLCTLFFFLLFQKSFASTYYFSSTTGDDARNAIQAQNQLTPWKSLNKLAALRNIISGDLILFKKGDVWTNATLTPNCEGVTFGNYGAGALPIIDGGPNLAVNIARTFKTGITINGIAFKRSLTTDIVAQFGNIWFDTDPGITNCKIQNCTFFGGFAVQGSYNLFENNIVDGTTNDGNGNGIWEHHKYCHHNIYRGNSISHFSVRGIWSMIETHDCLFENNNIHDCVYSGIDLDGAYYMVYSHTILNNTIYNVKEDAIELENAFDCLVRGNYMYGGGHSYMYVINYQKCEVYNGHGASMGLGAILNSTLIDNVMIGGGIDYTSVAIGIYKAGGVNVFNNSIYNYQSRFFNLDYTVPAEVPKIKLLNNIFSAIQKPSWYSMISFSTNDLNILEEDDYNCFFNNGINDIYSDYKTYNLKSMAQYRAATGKASHSISVNPMFLNSGDLHLQKSSPCIAGGIDVGYAYVGKAPDMGAYQFLLCDPNFKPVIQWFGK